MRLAILVEFRVIPDEHDSFHRLVLENAAASLKDERGCRQFDVLVPEGGARGHFTLYEIYDDAAAFEDHLRSGHYQLFAKTISPFVIEKSVLRFSMVEPQVGGAPEAALRAKIEH
jgi:(4S)-4-hydroxy-5-phosphonooxypentane-2,3-dione isomerase